jgi:hypothetical protein
VDEDNLDNADPFKFPDPDGIHAENVEEEPEHLPDPSCFPRHTKSLRSWIDPNVIEITAETYADKTDKDVCAWNPNNGGRGYIRHQMDRLWSDRPFLKILNVGSLEELDRKIKSYLGPLPTSGETWTWCNGQKLKDGRGRKYYCSFGGRASEKNKAKPKVRLR